MHVIGAAQTINCVHEYADWAEDERARASAAVAKLIDAVSEVWLQYDAMDDPELGAVVIILENSKATALAAEYGPDDKGIEWLAPQSRRGVTAEKNVNGVLVGL